MNEKSLLDQVKYPNDLRKLNVADLKQLATERLEKYNIEKLDSTIDYMWAEDWHDRWPDLIKYTKTLDSSRKENILDVVPEFEKWIPSA